jgi:hypothetical protein
MKFGFRIPSISKRIAANTSPSRIIRHSLGVKAPKGLGWVTNPKRFIYNKVYSKTTSGCLVFFIVFIGLPIALLLTIACHFI